MVCVGSVMACCSSVSVCVLGVRWHVGAVCVCVCVCVHLVVVLLTAADRGHERVLGPFRQAGCLLPPPAHPSLTCPPACLPVRLPACAGPAVASAHPSVCTLWWRMTCMRQTRWAHRWGHRWGVVGLAGARGTAPAGWPTRALSLNAHAQPTSPTLTRAHTHASTTPQSAPFPSHTAAHPPGPAPCLCAAQVTLYLRLLAEYPAAKTATGVEVTVPLPRSVQRVHCEAGEGVQAAVCVCVWWWGGAACTCSGLPGLLLLWTGHAALRAALPSDDAVPCCAASAVRPPPTRLPTRPRPPHPPHPRMPPPQTRPMRASCWRCPGGARLSSARSGGSGSASWCGPSRTSRAGGSTRCAAGSQVRPPAGPWVGVWQPRGRRGAMPGTRCAFPSMA